MRPYQIRYVGDHNLCRLLWRVLNPLQPNASIPSAMQPEHQSGNATTTNGSSAIGIPPQKFVSTFKRILPFGHKINYTPTTRRGALLCALLPSRFQHTATFPSDRFLPLPLHIPHASNPIFKANPYYPSNTDRTL